MTTTEPAQPTEKADGKGRGLAANMLDTAMVSGLVIVLTFLTSIALARILGPEGRGYYGTIQFLAQFAIMFFSLSMFDATVIRIRNGTAAAATFLPFALLLAGSLTLLVLIVAACLDAIGWLTVEGLPKWQALTLLAVIVAMGFCGKAFSSIESASLSFGRMNLERAVAPVLFMLGAMGLWFLGAASVASVLAVFIVAKLPVLSLRTYRYRKRIFGPVNLGFASEVLKLGPRLHAAMGTLVLGRQADRLIIVAHWPAEWLGYYFVAFAATGAGLSLASQAISITLLPSLIGLPTSEQRDKIERLIRLSLMSAIAVGVPLWVLAPTIVPLVYGEAFAPAAGFVQGLMVPMMLNPTLSLINVANRSFGEGRPGVETALTLLAVIGVGYAITGFSQPMDLFITLALANILAILVGLRHLVARGVARFGLNLLPRPSDAIYLVTAMTGHVRKLLGKIAGALGRTAKRSQT